MWGVDGSTAVCEVHGLQHKNEHAALFDFMATTIIFVPPAVCGLGMSGEGSILDGSPLVRKDTDVAVQPGSGTVVRSNEQRTGLRTQDGGRAVKRAKKHIPGTRYW